MLGIAELHITILIGKKKNVDGPPSSIPTLSKKNATEYGQCRSLRHLSTYSLRRG